MSMRASLTAAMLLGTLFVAGCSDTMSPMSPTSPSTPTVPAAVSPATSVGSSAVFSVAGNSDAAHACQQGGYNNLFRADSSVAWFSDRDGGFSNRFSQLPKDTASGPPTPDLVQLLWQALDRR